MATLNSITRSPADERVIRRALKILQGELRACGPALNSPDRVRQYLSLEIGRLEHEEFLVLWLDCQNRVIESERMFRGTLTQTSIYPREVVKRALQINAGACIFAHNHPSGVAEPSDADNVLTQRLESALAMVEVRLLDHFVIAGTQITSIMEIKNADQLRARARISEDLRVRRSKAAKKAWRRRRKAAAEQCRRLHK